MPGESRRYRSVYVRQWVAEGWVDGMVEGTARALITVLRTRGIEVSRAEEECLLDCGLDQLYRLLPQAVTVDSTEELLV
ncbi:hypothetical protein GCM10010404_15050 [Nonomuraea africana]|uniref:Fe-S cluster-containing MiaB family protein n=1 Tax=Nonomuraea africana TaxID=46171 RepID=A0ABR9KN02_9ACTN|nr:putative Fe-S cluster-containing MiaB family protein [Nonomuraea africana]